MSAAMDLAQVGPGFSDPVAASQAVFRAGLDALARPGSPLVVTSDAAAPAGVGTAACALLLALLDQDTALFVAPSHNAAVGAYFRFHTGCKSATAAAEADFLLFGVQDDWPDLAALNIGSEYEPDRSATLIREVAALVPGRGAALSGPGIDGRSVIDVPELNAPFAAQWGALRGLFPRGVDLFLTCGAGVCGLPRTTRIEVASCM